MQEIKYAGLIDCSELANSNWANSQSEFDGFHLKKVLLKQDAGNYGKDYFPHAEIVQDTFSILSDKSIELVIVAKPCDTDLNLVAEAIEAGKQVRVL